MLSTRITLNDTKLIEAPFVSFSVMRVDHPFLSAWLLFYTRLQKEEAAGASPSSWPLRLWKLRYSDGNTQPWMPQRSGRGACPRSLWNNL